MVSREGIGSVRWALQWLDNSLSKRELPSIPISEIAFESVSDHREGELIPGNVAFPVEPNRQAFLACRKVEVGEFCSIEHIDLRDMRQAEEGIEFKIVNASVSFLQRFPSCALLDSLSIFKKARWKRPFSASGLNRALTEQNLVLKNR